MDHGLVRSIKFVGIRSKQSKDMEDLIRNQENIAYLEELKEKL